MTPFTVEPKVRCPEFPPESTWLNVSRPLSLAEDLRGCVVVLDFWTYCCINCMHVLPVLARIEERFRGRPLVVIGVHSAKFISERDPENIRKAIGRHAVAHPVVVDSEHDIWEQFAVRAWPTLVLVDAEGYVRQTLPGEAREADLAAAIETLLEEGAGRGVLAPEPPDIAPDPEKDETFLRFPAKIHVQGDRLFIADSGHNRIVIAARDGRVQAIVGEGGAGAHDGEAAQASFHNPQGMAALDGTLFVADTGNHLIRAIDLETLRVRTIAGTGRKGEGVAGRPGDDPRAIAMRSPWALLALQRQLLIAMAGSHQIWVYDLDDNSIGPCAGSGREDHIDGPAREAALAQPSGLARSGRHVFIADSEVSSIRAFDMQEGVVQTIVGHGLFDFGDQDGAPQNVLLQHPLDVAVDGNVLYVADSYNNKVKAIAFGSMETRTAFGDGRRATLHEPGGLAIDQGRVLIADTNNHRILIGDPAKGSLEELTLRAGTGF